MNNDQTGCPVPNKSYVASVDVKQHERKKRIEY